MALRVLYLSQPALMQPWYDDFCRALGPECPVELYDPQHSFEEQVRDTGGPCLRPGKISAVGP